MLCVVVFFSLNHIARLVTTSQALIFNIFSSSGGTDLFASVAPSFHFIAAKIPFVCVFCLFAFFCFFSCEHVHRNAVNLFFGLYEAICFSRARATYISASLTPKIVCTDKQMAREPTCINAHIYLSISLM